MCSIHLPPERAFWVNQSPAPGFEDEFYFSRRFRKETQMAPRQYRKTYESDWK